MVCPACIAAAAVANAPMIAAALGIGGAAIGSRLGFARPRLATPTRDEGVRRRGRIDGDGRNQRAAPPPPRNTPAVYYNSFPERDD